jgi:prevent-host-death family protein
MQCPRNNQGLDPPAPFLNTRTGLPHGIISVYFEVYTGGVVEVTTKELRIQPGRIIDQVVHGEEVMVTFRGKAVARIVPVGGGRSKSEEQEQIFGMWESHSNDSSVEEMIRDLRKGRSF